MSRKLLIDFSDTTETWLKKTSDETGVSQAGIVKTILSNHIRLETRTKQKENGQGDVFE